MIAHSSTWKPNSNFRLLHGFESLEDRLLLSGAPVYLGDYNTAEIVGVDGVAYFSDGELFKSDGTVTGTVQVADIVPGGKTGPRNLTNVNGNIFFTATDGVYGYELWKSNGTAAGTVLVKDINNGPADSILQKFTKAGNKLYFVNATDNAHRELWVSNGTAAGTIKLAGNRDIQFDPQEMTAVGNWLYFTADDGVHGRELWKSNGTVSGTKLVKDIHVTAADPAASSSPSDLAEINGHLVFAAYNQAHGRELWRSDGTNAGTVLVANIAEEGPDSPGSSSPTQMTDVNGVLFFAARKDGDHGLWKSDGISGATLLKSFDENPERDGPGQFTNVDGRLFFTAYDLESDTVLWTSNGTTAGTRIVKDILPGKTGAEDIRYMTASAGKLFFSFWSPGPAQGVELWESDGTAAGTRIVADLDPGPADALPKTLTDVQGALFFTAAIAESTSTRSLCRYSEPVVVLGTTGNDTISVNARNENVVVRVNGVPQTYHKDSFYEMEVRGRAGNDTLIIIGSTANEKALLRKFTGSVLGPNYRVIANSIEMINVNGSGGNDVAELFGSNGNESFLGTPKFSYFKGPGFQNQVTYFKQVTARAGRGTDRATLIGSNAKDTFLGDVISSSLSGPGYKYTASGFDRVNAQAKSGDDIAQLFDSGDNDSFVGTPAFSFLKGARFFNNAIGFKKVIATASTGNDIANLFDSPGKDTLFGRNHYGKLSNSNFFYRAHGFDKLIANANGGGIDTLNVKVTGANKIKYALVDLGSWENIV